MRASVASDLVLRNPMTGIAGCCARAASGHAAAPPNSAKSLRRFIVTSLDNLIGQLLEMQRHVKADRLGCLEIDDEFELDLLSSQSALTKAQPLSPESR